MISLTRPSGRSCQNPEERVSFLFRSALKLNPGRVRSGCCLIRFCSLVRRFRRYRYLDTFFFFSPLFFFFDRLGRGLDIASSNTILAFLLLFLCETDIAFYFFSIKLRRVFFFYARNITVYFASFAHSATRYAAVSDVAVVE